MQRSLAVILTFLAAAAPAYAQPTRQVERQAVRPGAVSPGPNLLAALRARGFALPDVTATLNAPTGLALDAAGNLYVANAQAGVNVYARGRGLIATITSGVSAPVGVAINFAGDVYVGNSGTNTVSIYSPSFAPMGAITDASINGLEGLYIDKNDDLWVLDAAGLLHSYLDNGTVLPTTYTGGTAVGPWGADVTVWGVLDPSVGYIEAYQNVGEALHNGPNLSNFLYPSPQAGAETEDYLGQQYVTDIANQQVVIFSADGLNEVGTFTTPAMPFGIAVDSAHGRIYVSIVSLNEVVIYSIKPPYHQIGVIH